jgi:hypothetical protein
VTKTALSRGVALLKLSEAAAPVTDHSVVAVMACTYINSMTAFCLLLLLWLLYY